MRQHQKLSNVIVVKIGSESINQVPQLIPDIRDIIQNTHYKIILITSGAVEFGRRALWIGREDMKHRTQIDADFKRRLAAYGQPALIEFYNRLLFPYKIHAAQILANHADIEDDTEHFMLARELISGVWKDGNLPIINENDALTKEEINGLKRGSDNDENARLWALRFHAEMLAIVTSTDGVYAKQNVQDSRIPLLPADIVTDTYAMRICWDLKNKTGTGGLASKIIQAKTVIKEMNRGTVHIFDGVNSSLMDHLEYHKTIQAWGHLQAEEIKGGTVLY